MQANTTQHAVHRPEGYGIKTERVSSGGQWHHGHVTTKNTIVVVYSEDRFAFLSLIKEGMHYARTFDRGYTPRGLVTLAAKFAREIFND